MHSDLKKYGAPVIHGYPCLQYFYEELINCTCLTELKFKWYIHSRKLEEFFSVPGVWEYMTKIKNELKNKFIGNEKTKES